MPAFFIHVFELISGHLIAGLLISLIAIYLLKPAKNYWQSRAWLKRATDVGVRNFFPSRESYATDRSLAFADYLSSAKKELTYFGHWLAFSAEQHGTLDVLIKRAQAGVHIRLIILHPELPKDVLNTYSRYFGEDPDTLKKDVAATWQRVWTAHANLGANEQARFELQAHSEFIPYSAFWFDPGLVNEHILIDMKIFGKSSRRNAYGLELHPTSTKTSSRYPSLFLRYANSLSELRKLSEKQSAPKK